MAPSKAVTDIAVIILATSLIWPSRPSPLAHTQQCSNPFLEVAEKQNSSKRASCHPVALEEIVIGVVVYESVLSFKCAYSSVDCAHGETQRPHHKETTSLSCSRSQSLYSANLCPCGIPGGGGG